jgi:hypothetical protein
MISTVIIFIISWVKLSIFHARDNVGFKQRKYGTAQGMLCLLMLCDDGDLELEGLCHSDAMHGILYLFSHPKPRISNDAFIARRHLLTPTKIIFTTSYI